MTEEEIKKAAKEHGSKLPQWISAKDRLPENDDNVIIHGSGGYVGIYWYSKEDNIFVEAWGNNSNDINADEVDYWMPIPKIEEEKK